MFDIYSLVMHYPIYKSLILARKIETLGCGNKFGKLRLYSVDLLPTQMLLLLFCSFHAIAASRTVYYLES
jgi:hypothetical protein